MATGRVLRIPVLAVLLLVLCPWDAAGQNNPLRKTDLVRLLTNPQLTKGQVAQRVLANCLAFDPTDRDLSDLRAAGADAAVMGAINQCVRRARQQQQQQAPPPQQPRPQPRPAAPQPLRVAAVRSRVGVAAGTQATLQVQVSRGGRAVSGMPVTLRDQESAASGRAATDARGIASFRVNGGTEVGVRRFAVTEVGGESVSGPQFELVTVAGAPASALVEPRRIDVRPDATHPVSVTLRDEYGNAVSGQRVEFRPLTPELSQASGAGETDASGQLRASFPASVLTASGQIGVFVGGAQLASLEVSAIPVVLSDALTRFVAGAGQEAEAGQALGEPLVLEVRDTTDRPVVGETVTFAATNGAVAPESATTNDSGRVSVSVIAGRTAGTLTVAATAGEVRKEVAIDVDPGPAARLVVMHDTVPLAGGFQLRSSRPVTFRVTARDSLGNDVPVTGVRATVQGEPVVRVVRAGSGQVELRGRETGSASLQIEAAGISETLTAQVFLPVAAGQWVVALRGGYTTFSYAYRPTWNGHPGPIGEIMLGRTVIEGLTVGVASTFAMVKADDGTSAPGAVSVLNTSIRLEYAPPLPGQVSPVLLAGGGQFQSRSGDWGDAARHTSYFWLAGAGVDYRMNPRMAVQLRATMHQLREMTSLTLPGPMGSLIALTAGVRFGF